MFVNVKSPKETVVLAPIPNSLVSPINAVELLVPNPGNVVLAGVYFLRFNSETNYQVQKVILLK